MSAPGAPSVLLGTFDGVHCGHQAMINFAGALSAEADPVRPLHIATFWPHPRAVVGAGAPPLLCTLERRVELLRDCGADEVHVIRFTPEFAAQTPEQFVEHWLVDDLGAGAVVVGQNFRFGHKAAGTTDDLVALCSTRGVEVAICDIAESHHAAVSSTRIRAAINEGRVDGAAEMLGRPFRLGGVVEGGARRGRELGYPTANLSTPPEMAQPAEGVYAAIAYLHGRRYPAAVSVGTNPQFGGDHVTVEAYLLDHDDSEFYGAHVELDFIEHVRGQQVFPGVDDLVRQIGDDVERVRQIVEASPLAPSRL